MYYRSVVRTVLELRFSLRCTDEPNATPTTLRPPCSRGRSDCSWKSCAHRLLGARAREIWNNPKRRVRSAPKPRLPVSCGGLVVSDSCSPMDCCPPGSSVHGILQARILEWDAMASSRGPSWPKHRTLVSCIAGRFFTNWATGIQHPEGLP